MNYERKSLRLVEVFSADQQSIQKTDIACILPNWISWMQVASIGELIRSSWRLNMRPSEANTRGSWVMWRPQEVTSWRIKLIQWAFLLFCLINFLKFGHGPIGSGSLHASQFDKYSSLLVSSPESHWTITFYRFRFGELPFFCLLY